MKTIQKFFYQNWWVEVCNVFLLDFSFVFILGEKKISYINLCIEMIADEFLRSHLPLSRLSILVIWEFAKRMKNRTDFLFLNRSHVPLIYSLIRKNVGQSIDLKSREASRADKYFMTVLLRLFPSYHIM